MVSTEKLASRVLWSAKDCCVALNIGRTTLSNLTQERKIPSVKIGRRRLYPRDAVLDWLNELGA